MASNRIIEVRIKSEIAKTKEKASTPKNDIKDEKGEQKSLFDNVLVNQTFNLLKNQVSEMAMYGVERHLTLTDDYVGERYLTAGLNVINRTVSIGSTIMAGASVGGVVGAVIGAVAGVGNLIFDIVKNYDQQNILIKQMDKQLEFQRQRAGYSLTSGSIGENK